MTNLVLLAVTVITNQQPVQASPGLLKNTVIRQADVGFVEKGKPKHLFYVPLEVLGAHFVPDPAFKPTAQPTPAAPTKGTNVADGLNRIREHAQRLVSTNAPGTNSSK